MGCGCIQPPKKYGDSMTDMNNELTNMGRRNKKEILIGFKDVKDPQNVKNELLRAKETIIKNNDEIQKLKEINLKLMKEKIEMQKQLKGKMLAEVSVQTEFPIQNLNKSAFQKLKQQNLVHEQQYRTQIRNLEQKVFYYKQELDKCQQQKSKKEQQQKIVSKYPNLFQSDILLNKIPQLQYLIEKIQKNIKKPIISTKRIYSSYKEAIGSNKVTTALNQRPSSFVVVTKIRNNGFIVAGWTEKGFCKQVIQPKGLIFSLTNKISVPLKPKQKTAAYYEGNYLIFGNSELRINFIDKLLVTNLGIQNGSYNDQKRYDALDLLGSNQIRQVELEAFEIYQLTLQ